RPVSISVDPTGRYAYVANQVSNTISQYNVGSDGALAPMSAPAVPAGSAVSAVTIDPSGKVLYATNRGTATGSQFNIEADGSLTPMTNSPASSGAHPTAIATGY